MNECIHFHVYYIEWSGEFRFAMNSDNKFKQKTKQDIFNIWKEVKIS